MRFHFTKPEGFEYKAGQSIDIVLVDPPETDSEGNSRSFSLVSTPDEPDLSIATRMRDTAFKRSLKTISTGTPLNIDGPFGDFSLHEKTSRPAVFLAGGIGITPFYSMVKDATHRELPHSIILFYSNRRPEDAAFLAELQEISAKNSHSIFVPTMTNLEQSSQEWSGERGYITVEMIKKYVDPGTEPIYYLAGPAPMVVAMRSLLNGMGVSNDDIRTEEFAGY